MERVLFILYNLLFHLLGLAAIPVFLMKIAKYKHSFKQKLGFLPRGTLESCRGSPRIWVNAVSVGEVVAVSPIVKAIKKLYPKSCIIVSTGTETGQNMARQLIKDASAYIYFPVDIPPVVGKMLRAVAPDVFLTSETEIWPNFLRCAKRMGVKTMLVNGRISVRSVARYYRARLFFRRVLTFFDSLGMASEADAERIRKIGAPGDRVAVTGNSKFDALVGQVQPRFEQEMRRVLRVRPGEDVLVAASTHPGEEEVIVDSYKRLLREFPELILVIVPRHVERVPEIEKLLRHSGFDSHYLRTGERSGKKRRQEPVIVIGTTGELFKVYSIGTVVFCGGSLTPRGGQNILEPAAWGKVILYGPSMEDFLEAKRLLEEVGAGFLVRDTSGIVSVCRRLLIDSDERSRRGEAGKKAILARAGAAEKTAQLVSKLIATDYPPRGGRK